MRTNAVLRPAALFLLLPLLLSLFLAPPRPARALDGQESRLLRLINELRDEHNLSPLKLSPKLTRASEWLSRDMAANDYMSHTDSKGRDPFERMDEFRYRYETYRGENIAAGNDTAAEAFEQWTDSPVHRENMLNPEYHSVGIGRAYDDDSKYGWYWTTDFGGVADTRTSGGLRKQGGKFRVAGRVVGHYPGRRVVVRVQKRVYDASQGSYVWRGYSSRGPRLSRHSAYRAGFKPRKGTYRVRAYFSGRGYVKPSRSPYRYFRVR